MLMKKKKKCRINTKQQGPLRGSSLLLRRFERAMVNPSLDNGFCDICRQRGGGEMAPCVSRVLEHTARALLSNGPGGPGPRAPELQGAPERLTYV